MKKVFFVDFDGTVTKVDTGVAMEEAFISGDYQSINELWRRKEISTSMCANLKFRLIYAGLDDLQKLITAIEIDDYFLGFLEFCSRKGYKIYIVSDGYDFNIETVFKKYRIELMYYANRLVYKNGAFQMEPGYPNLSCGHCGTCKKQLIECLRGEATQVVYIGDGYSDLCAASCADLIYAKGVLFDYCSKQGIPAVGFKDFSEILTSLLES